MGPILGIHKFWAKHFKWASGKPTGVKTCQPLCLFLINTPTTKIWCTEVRTSVQGWFRSLMNTKAGSWTSMKKKVFQRQLSFYFREHQQLLEPRSIAGTAAVGSSCRYSAKLASVGYTIGGWWLTQQFVVCYNQPAPLNPFLSLSRQTIYLSKNMYIPRTKLRQNNILCQRK